MTDNKHLPDTSDRVEHTVNNPTEPLEQPEHTTGGGSHRPPAGYFTDPSLSPTREAAAGSETPERQNSPAGTQPGRHPARVGTIVWGAVVLVAGILLILATQLNLNLDAGLTTMWLLLGAGVAMVAGGAVNLMQRK